MAIKINGNTVIDDSQNFTSNSSVSATGTITGGNIATGGTVSATGNITGANLQTGGLITATGNVYGGNFVTANTVINADVSTLGNVIAKNLSSTANISAAGNISGSFISVSGNVNAGGYIVGNIIGSVSAVGNVGAVQFHGSNGALAGSDQFTFDSTNNIAYSFRVHCGNGGFGTPVGISTMLIGNINPSAIHMGGDANQILIGNVSSNTRFAGNVSVIGNIIPGASILSSGLISTSGNVNAGAVNTALVKNTSTLTIATSAGNVAIQPAGNVVLSNVVINGLATPQQDQDAATKAYVDQVATTGLSFHQAVTVATTSNLATATGGTITYTQPNGASNGVGAQITTTGSFNLIDTANVQTVGTRILVKNEGNAVLNGVYTWANATTIVRSTDTDEYGSGSSEQISLNDYFFVQSGNVNAGSAFVVDSPTGTITFGTSNITFAQFSSSQVYSANTNAGLSLTGTVFSAKVDNNTTAFGLGGNISVKAGANLTTPNIGDATGSSLSTTGNVTGGNIVTGGLVSATGAINAVANISGGNLLSAGIMSAAGNVRGGNVLTAGFVSATGNVTAANYFTTGVVSAASNVSASNLNLTGSIFDTGPLNISTASNGNIGLLPNGTGIVTASSAISATGNVIGGNVTTVGLISATGNITGSYFFGNGSQLTGIDATGIQNGTANVRTFLNGNVTVSAAGTGNVLNVTSTGTITTGTASVTGNITGGNLSVGTGTISVGNIVNTNGNGVGNIGSSSLYFNTVFAKATSAQYADLAEKYTADADYEPGTVVMFGGSQEVTQCVADACTRVAGVISTNPSYIMNGTLDAPHVAVVALTGRVPTRVTGTVRKGDLMVSAGNGSARAEANPRVGTVIGKALADHDGADGVIEVVVGRF